MFEKIEIDFRLASLNQDNTLTTHSLSSPLPAASLVKGKHIGFTRVNTLGKEMLRVLLMRTNSMYEEDSPSPARFLGASSRDRSFVCWIRLSSFKRV